MSVIQDALKRARESRRQKESEASGAPPPAPSVVAVTVTKGPAVSWLWWLTLALFLAESGLIFREFQLRRKSETKLHQALLLLNDERGKSLDLLKEKTEFEGQLAALQDARDKAIAEKESLAQGKRRVEFENLEKEKKVSQMTKEMHVLQMRNVQLANEVQTLKRRVAELSVVAPAPVSLPSADSSQTVPRN